MSLRDWISRNPAVVMLLAVVLLALALGVLMSQLTDGRGRGPGVVSVYYFDPADGSLFEGPSDQVPPVPAPSGEPAPLAHVFACGSCDDPAKRQVGFLVRFTDEYKSMKASGDLATLQGDEYDRVVIGGKQVSADEGKTWVPASSPAGDEVKGNVASRLNCSDTQPLVSCKP